MTRLPRSQDPAVLAVVAAHQAGCRRVIDAIPADGNHSDRVTRRLLKQLPTQRRYEYGVLTRTKGLSRVEALSVLGIVP